MIKKLLTVICAMLLLCLLPSLAWGLGTAEISGSPTIRVMLDYSSSASFTVTNGTYYIVSEKALGSNTVYQSSMTVFDRVDTGESFTLSSGSGRAAVPADKDCTCKYGYYSYRGAFKVGGSGSYDYVINQLDVESYLYGVVGNEIGSWNEESMKAQAVAARSYAVHNISTDNKNYDVTDSTASQVYRGYSSEDSFIRSAVDATRGWMLTYRGDIIEAYYSSSNGGYSENVENVWMSDAVPFVGVPCPYDKEAGTNPKYGDYAASCWSWNAEYSPSELVYLANRYGNTDIGEFVSISMSTSYNGRSSVSGRAMRVTIKGTKDSVTATKDDIRSLLNLRSTLFTFGNDGSATAGAYVLSKGDKLEAWDDVSGLYAISGSGSVVQAGGSDSGIAVLAGDGQRWLSKTAAESEASGTVVINGRGYGHGVGMSQWGAIAMGDNGYSWREIIDSFYCRGGIELTDCY